MRFSLGFPYKWMYTLGSAEIRLFIEKLYLHNPMINLLLIRIQIFQFTWNLQNGIAQNATRLHPGVNSRIRKSVLNVRRTYFTNAEDVIHDVRLTIYSRHIWKECVYVKGNCAVNIVIILLIARKIWQTTWKRII